MKIFIVNEVVKVQALISNGQGFFVLKNKEVTKNGKAFGISDSKD